MSCVELDFKRDSIGAFSRYLWRSSERDIQLAGNETRR